MVGQRVGIVSRLARVRAVSYGALLLAAGFVWLAGWGDRTWWASPALAVAVAASELAVVHVAFARQRWTFTVTEGVIGGALLVHGGGWAVVSVLVGVAIAQAVRRLAWVKLQYNTAQITASAALAVVVAQTLGGGAVGVVVGMCCYWALNQLLSAVPLAIMSGSPLGRLASQDAPLHAVHAAASVSIGMLAAWLGAHEPYGLLGLIAPLGLLWMSYDEQTARTAEARLFAELANGHERATGRSTDLSAQVVVTAAARLFGGADVEMVLIGLDGPVLYAGDEHGASRHRAHAATLDEAWVLRALGSTGVQTGVEPDGHPHAGRPYCSAVLGPADLPLAVLIARRAAASGTFGRREAMLADVLVQQAQSWLSVAELTRSRDDARAQAEAAEEAARALGDLGAEAAPSLLVLRESAARLARLATTPAGPDIVVDIVDELHAVERAVASLLGAVALAADPDLGRLDPHVPAPRSQEWTTTGVLAEVEPR